MGNITAKNMKKSAKTLRHELAPHSVPDVDRALTTTDVDSYGTEVAKCSLILLRALAEEMITSDTWFMAHSRALKKALGASVPNAEQVLQQIMERIHGTRSRNPFSDFMG